jgi:predicted DNA-binding protein
MRKVQVLFPDPELRRLKELAKREDRPLSEIIRRATEAYLERLPDQLGEDRRVKIPVFDGGRTLASPASFRELAYRDRAAGVAGNKRRK